MEFLNFEFQIEEVFPRVMISEYNVIKIKKKEGIYSLWTKNRETKHISNEVKKESNVQGNLFKKNTSDVK